MAQYLPTPRLVPATYRLGVYTAPKALLDTIDSSQLPANWTDFPYPASTQKLGSQWIASKSNMGLILPSTTIPIASQEFLTPDDRQSIVLVDALHEKCRQIKLVKSTKELFNTRIFSGMK